MNRISDFKNIIFCGKYSSLTLTAFVTEVKSKAADQKEDLELEECYWMDKKKCKILCDACG